MSILQQLLESGFLEASLLRIGLVLEAGNYSSALLALKEDRVGVDRGLLLLSTARWTDGLLRS